MSPWIFSLTGFSVMSDMDTLSVSEFLLTLCFVGPCSALEGSFFYRPVFPTLSEGIQSRLRNLMSACTQPGLEDPSQFYRWSPSC